MERRRRRREEISTTSKYPPSTILGADKRAAIDFADFMARPTGNEWSSSIELSVRTSPAQEFVRDPVASEAQSAHDLIASIEEMCESGDEDEGADVLFNVLEHALRSGRFATVDALLDALDPARVDVGVTLVALTITWHARDELSSRDYFSRCAEPVLIRKLGQERAEALLASRR